jgi:hypothetical protein
MPGQEYQRISLDESQHGGCGVGAFQVRVLLGQKTLVVKNVKSSMTVLEFKELIAAEHEDDAALPPERQRVICKGRELKPDWESLSKFSVAKDSILHCFPRPPPSVVAELVQRDRVAAATATAALPTATAESAGSFNPMGLTHRTRTIWADHAIQDSARDVRMWCFILLFLSGTSCFDIFAYLLSNGTFGRNSFDSLTQFIHLGCSIAGIHVANLGLNSVRTVEVAAIKKYVASLSVLLLANTVYQVLSVYDLVFQVQDAYDEQQAAKDATHDDELAPTPHPTAAPDDDVARQQQGPIELTPELISDFKYQMWVFAAIVMLCWVTCLMRAVRFHMLVVRNSALAAADGVDPEAASTTASDTGAVNPIHATASGDGDIEAPPVAAVAAVAEAVNARAAVEVEMGPATATAAGLVVVERPVNMADQHV